MVVDVGLTVAEPFSVEVDTPISGVMLMLVAFVDVHVRVDDEPSAMVVGVALIDTVGRLLTVTVTLPDTLPDTLLAVSIYVVVTVGDTEYVPLIALTAPTPWSIIADVAPEMFQLNVELPPSVIVAGLAVYEFITGRLLTVTVAVSVTVTAPFTAVIVYIVVTVGDTKCDPLAPTVPMPWSMDTVVAFADDHVRVDEEPSAIAVGVAFKDTVTVCVGLTVMVTLSVASVPSVLLAVII